jgi:hypothetical protein
LLLDRRIVRERPELVVARGVFAAKLNELFIELDRRYYSGRLHAAGWRVKLISLSPLGRYHGGEPLGETRHKGVIFIKERLAFSRFRKRRELVPRVLMHEIVHAWLMEIDSPANSIHFGLHHESFCAELARISEGTPFAQDLLLEAKALWLQEERAIAAVRALEPALDHTA